MAALSNSVTITAGQTNSPNIPLGNLTLTGISCPTLTSTNLSVAVSSDGGQTFQSLYLDNSTGQANAQYLILPATSTGGKYVAINPAVLFGVDLLQLVLGSTQAGNVTFILHIREKR